MNFSRIFVAVAACFFAASQLHADDEWTRFRGPNGTGISSQTGIPSKWTPEDYRWNIELPGDGHSSPIITHDLVFVTSAVDEGRLRLLHAISVDTGKIVWSRELNFQSNHIHNKNSFASGTPATDGTRIFVPFADEQDYILAAFDLRGEPLWRSNLGPFNSSHGQGTSPIIYDDLVILANDQQGPSSLQAFHRETGERVWNIDRTVRRTSYATPMILERPDAAPQLICLSGAMGLTGHNPATGEMIWQSGELPMRTVASPILAGNLLFAMCGSGGRGKHLEAVDPSGTGQVGQTHVRYIRKKILPYVPTPISFNDLLFLWCDDGVVVCTDPSDGTDVWQKRVGGNFSGSPICVDGKIYTIDESGLVSVIAASDEYQLLGQTPLDDLCHSTPAVASGCLFLRTAHRLACLPAAEDMSKE